MPDDALPDDAATLRELATRIRDLREEGGAVLDRLKMRQGRMQELLVGLVDAAVPPRDAPAPAARRPLAALPQRDGNARPLQQQRRRRGGGGGKHAAGRRAAAAAGSPAPPARAGALKIEFAEQLEAACHNAHVGALQLYRLTAAFDGTDELVRCLVRTAHALSTAGD
eukprot:gene12866-19830_t